MHHHEERTELTLILTLSFLAWEQG